MLRREPSWPAPGPFGIHARPPGRAARYQFSVPEEAFSAKPMPNTKSAKKRLRQNVVRRARNRAVKSALRTQCRKVRDAVKAGDLETAESEYRLAAKKADQAGARNIVHRNTAARIKSRLSARIKHLKQQPAEA